MYSRYSQKDEPLQIPEHYSGCAFPTQKNKPTSLPARPSSSFLEVGKPATTPPIPDKQEYASTPPRDEIHTPCKESPAVTTEKKCDEETTHTSAPIPRLLGNLGSAFPFSHGLGFEELLILGLIILLSRGEEESDLILLLGLLLFCG